MVEDGRQWVRGQTVPAATHSSGFLYDGPAAFGLGLPAHPASHPVTLDQAAPGRLAEPILVKPWGYKPTMADAIDT